MPTAQRGIDAHLEKGWAHAIEKENMLRLKWFRTNERRLNEISNKPPNRAVPEEVTEKYKEAIVDNYRNVIKNPRIKTGDADPLIDPRAMQAIMKPVNPATTRLIYSGSNKDGRKNYLTKRVHQIPEDRFYFPEVSSWAYGWNMWDVVKETRKTGFGRQQVIKDSFYRRRGVGCDPEWYKEPAVFSPSICSCN
ncbi:unnamed protein product [Phaedon cochleariae]|uniref:Sperm microtubule inner protein 1 C-terminal domain-containing protein n=1 Tax=Phaedon cochleariae TaxID=80249 RepID=A0A9N9SD74_PHACE|nr:unnamed protein product [Phaedon cochleariae]